MPSRLSTCCTARTCPACTVRPMLRMLTAAAWPASPPAAAARLAPRQSAAGCARSQRSAPAAAPLHPAGHARVCVGVSTLRSIRSEIAIASQPMPESCGGQPTGKLFIRSAGPAGCSELAAICAHGSPKQTPVSHCTAHPPSAVRLSAALLSRMQSSRALWYSVRRWPTSSLHALLEDGQAVGKRGGDC